MNTSVHPSRTSANRPLRNRVEPGARGDDSEVYFSGHEEESASDGSASAKSSIVDRRGRLGHDDVSQVDGAH
jgi:hypothetical protein